MSSPPYDIVLFGATGYTGVYTAEHIASSLPSNLNWAVAGRNQHKLDKLVSDLQKINPDRKAPGVEICSLDLPDLKQLVKKGKVLINAVGPYSRYGRNVVEACATEGTHYIDTTGEVPWVKDMIARYHDMAKASGAIIITQSGFESAISDLLAFSMVSYIRSSIAVGTTSVVATLWDLEAAPSGGTLGTAFSIFDVYDISYVISSMKPYALSSGPPPNDLSAPGLFQKLSNGLFGVRSVPDLGLATTSVTGVTNAALVQRSWGLKPDFYGENFKYEELAAVRNRAIGVAVHYAITIGSLAVALPPLRWLISKFVFAPGEGPTRESTKNDRAEYRAVAVAEGGRKVQGAVKWKGSMYDLTGVLLAQGAMSILEEEERVKKEFGGGMLTPAMLGESYLERAKKVGVDFSVGWLV